MSKTWRSLELPYLRFNNSNNTLFYSDIRGRVKDEISGPFLRYSKDALVACYSIHSRVEIDEQPLQKTRDRKGISFSDEVIRFYVNETEMMNPRIEPGVYFSVHSPFEVTNPFHKGMFLKGGRSYTLYVEMEQEILLKDPFESNCMDYEELWEKNNRTGPRTKMMCKEKCLWEYSLDDHGCTYFSVLYPHKERICEDESSSNLTTPRPLIYHPWATYEYCLENCRDECRHLTLEEALQLFDEHESDTDI